MEKMRVGPSESSFRRRLQTAHCCCGRKSVVVSEWVNDADVPHYGRCWGDERKRTADDVS